MKKIYLAAAISLSVLAAVSAQDPAPAPAPAKAAQAQTVDINDIKQFDQKNMLKKNPLNTDKFVFNTFLLAPRQVLKMHKHPASDELFYIAEGKGQFVAVDAKFPVAAGSAVYGPADAMHGLVNSGDTGMVVISVQSPKPVNTVFAEKASVKCPMCGQENIVPQNAKPGDIIICPRCGTRIKLAKDKEGNWTGTEL